MKKRKKLVAVVMSGVMAVSAFLMSACNSYTYTAEDTDEMALELALALMGNDAFAWNAYSVTPYQTYGYVAKGEPSWYSYYGTPTKSEINQNLYVFNVFYDELEHVNSSALSGATAASYRTMKNIVELYRDYYKSKYVTQFELLGGSYISSDGGYVADFASSFENFAFRNESDVKKLLAITKSTDDAFTSYIDFAADRSRAGYPLYDYTVASMQDYLSDVYAQGDDYYLFEFADSKIDGAEFLSQAQKDEYKAAYKSALKQDFMIGVKLLSDGLERYKGRVNKSEVSYLAAAGDAGKAYYEWLFRQKTGIKNANIGSVYLQLFTAYQQYYSKRESIVAQAEALKETDKETYDEFQEYYGETRALLGLAEPDEILAYLKTAAKDIVPDLKSDPDIGFKYMDDTVAQRSNAVAYYMRTPLDGLNSREMITLNGYQIQNSPSELLTTIAHEGYPGHLYAHVNSKEIGTSLLSTCMSNISFSEGWANYVELALLDNIANDASTSKAAKMYCEYSKYRILSGYLGMLIYDIQINYLGVSADDYKGQGSDGTDMIEMMMEIPAVYVPYGYGMYTMYTIHEQAKSELGAKYGEAEFNGRLLSEGFGPTLARAKDITNQYISEKKKAK